MKSKLCVLALTFLPTFSALHAQLEPGDSMPSLRVQDQHEESFLLDSSVRYLLVSFDMSTGKAANRYLEEKGSEYLPAHRAVFLSNIDGMPWVGRKFALPKMRKYPHRILLADEPERELLSEFPQHESRVTVFELNDGLEIVGIDFWDPDSEPLPIRE